MKAASDVSPTAQFLIGECIVDPNAGRISRDGQEIRLEPRVMDVLVYLARHPNVVISHETLEAEVWAGMVVGYSSIPNSIIKLRKALGDNSRNPRYIETVSKRGYRLIADVQQCLNKQSFADIRPAPAAVPSILKNRDTILAGSFLLAVLFGWLIYQSNIPPKPAVTASTDKPAVLVLPFNNLSGDTQGENLSEGITDDLITDLSRVSELRVIARQTSYHYKNNHATPQQLSRQLKVQYIVEGSLRKSGKQIRLNVQLTNVAKDESIWAQRIETDTDSIFSAQNNIANNVTKAIYSSLSIKGKSPPGTRKAGSFEAYDAFLVGQRYAKIRSRDGYEQTIKAYHHAINIDPNYARVYGALAVTLTRGYRYQWSDLSLVEARERALKFARQAVSLDQTTPQIYWSLSYVHLHRHEYDKAERGARQSVSLSPSYADGYAMLANILNWRGKSENAEKYVKKAMQLNPYYTYQYPSTLGTAYYQQGRYLEAISILNDAVERNETALNPHIYLAASYRELGMGDEAAWEVSQMNVSHPNVKVSSLGTVLPYENTKYLQQLKDDLRQAGMQE